MSDEKPLDVLRAEAAEANARLAAAERVPPVPLTPAEAAAIYAEGLAGDPEAALLQLEARGYTGRELDLLAQRVVDGR